MYILLLTLVIFVGLTATISGMMLIAIPDGALFSLSTSLLATTPFTNYIIPGILLTGIGTVHLAALLSAVQKSRKQYNWMMAGGGLLCAWIISEMILIPVFHWLQYVYLLVGLLIILMSYQLKGKWAA